MINISIEEFDRITEAMRGKQIAVIGDVMLDRYFWGSVTRVSPEAPVPVVDLEREEFHLGGAANSAANIISLAGRSSVCGIIGRDEGGEKFTSIANSEGMNTSGLFQDENRPTTVKTRIFGNKQQLVRLDNETNEKSSSEFKSHALNFIKDQLSSISALIFADYDKGTLNKELISELISICKSNNIKTYADPKADNFFAYKGVDVFKPNLREASDALNMRIETDDEINIAGKILLEMLECKSVLLTLGAGGMRLFEASGSIFSVKTNAHHVSDVSGAGDTVLATFAMAISSGASNEQAAHIANIAAGTVCEKPGIVSAKISEIREHIK